MESFFHLLKAEIGPLKRVRFETAHRTIVRYIEQLYYAFASVEPTGIALQRRLKGDIIRYRVG